MKTNIKDKTQPQFAHKTIEWTGKSGKKYYSVWTRGAKIQGRPSGNFLHVKVKEDGNLEPVYISQTDNLNRRILSPDEQECIDATGATQIHIRTNYKGEQDRIAEVADLVARWLPVCNFSPRMVSVRRGFVELARTKLR